MGNLLLSITALRISVVQTKRITSEFLHGKIAVRSIRKFASFRIRTVVRFSIRIQIQVRCIADAGFFFGAQTTVPCYRQC